jgi:iron complex outermembrane receptor protein
MPRATKTAVRLLAPALFVLPGEGIAAQKDPGAILEEIIVVGTRREARTVSNSPVPVDAFQGEELERMGTTDMDEMLRNLVPSYTLETYPLNDEASLIRPAALRGLPPDNTLVLVNGKRRHRGGVIAFSTQGPDVSAIPAIAIKRVEVLRDGASAQYGSDAIAGVINYVLRDSREGLSLEYMTGEYYAGDGEIHQLALNGGLPLGEGGFANLSLEYGERDATSRSVQRPDAQNLIDAGVEGIPQPAQNWGQPAIDDDLKLFVNAAVSTASDGELYSFGNYSQREVELEFFWRNPNAQDGIYTVYPDSRLVFDMTGRGSGDCPQAGTPDALSAPDPFSMISEAEFEADQAALDAIAADPDCWVINEIYPAGYRPEYSAEITDHSIVLGFRRDLASGFRYDLSASQGASKVEYRLENSINASLGPESPSSFRPGTTTQTEINLNAELAWLVDIDSLNSPLSLAVGFEWRQEAFEVTAGSPPSWTIGPLASQGASIGSHGYPGITPALSDEWSRDNYAVYLDLEADITANLLLGLAVRYEDFEDFGSTTNFKAAMRYQLTDALAIRGSASTGFRAPTPGQSNYSRLQTFFFDGQLFQEGRIAPTNPIAEFFGAEPLEPEESTNYSAGITFAPLDNFTLTADYFHVEVDDIMVASERFEVTPDIADTLVALGITSARDFAFVNFFINGGTREIDGVDLVATYAADWQDAAQTRFSLAWNHTEIDIRDSEAASRFGVIFEENWVEDRVILTVDHRWQDLRLLLRGSYYGGWKRADFSEGGFEPVCTDERPNPPGTDHCYGSTWVVDVEASYTFRDRYTLSIGADNVFDEYPEKDYAFPDNSFGRKYPESSPIGYMGGFWYLRLRADF